MFYQECQPCAVLADFVKCFWLMEAPQNPFPAKEILIPDGCIELIFNLGTPYKRFKSENDFALLKNSHLVGERDRFFLIEQTRAVHLIAVRFKPGGLYPFVRFPVAEATNQTIDLDLIFGNRIKDEKFISVSLTRASLSTLVIISGSISSKYPAKPFSRPIISCDYSGRRFTKPRISI